MGEIKKLRSDKSKKWPPLVPASEPKELDRVFRCKDATFERYLRWHDLKLKGLPFSLIARIESGIKVPEEREKAFEQQLSKQKKTPISKRVKGESAVKKGFDTIFLAIHRTPAPSDEDLIPTVKQYN